MAKRHRGGRQAEPGPTTAHGRSGQQADPEPATTRQRSERQVEPGPTTAHGRSEQQADPEPATTRQRSGRQAESGSASARRRKGARAETGQRRRGERRVETVGTGVAELVGDPDRPSGWTLLLDGAPQSHVDLADPTYLEFEYIRRMAAAIDLIAPAGTPLRALHLGGGALTLPRYLAATRPGSPQRVVEIDGPLVDLVRAALPWDPRYKLRVRVGDAREAVTGAGDGGYDLIVVDVFAGARTPAHLASVEFIREAARVLAPGGWLIANVADGPPLRYARRQVATIRAVLPEACVVADAAVLRGRRFGNLVVVAGRTPPPVAELSRRAAGDWFPGRVETDLDRFTSGHAPATDIDAVPSPAPPESLFSARP